MDKYQQSIVTHFKGFNSISNKKIYVQVAVKVRGIEVLQFASVADMQADELGAWLISKMNREQKGKLGL
jgi:hypothetical protein